MFVGEYLIVFFMGLRGKWHGAAGILGGVPDIRLDVYKFTTFQSEGFVQVHKECPLPLVYGQEVVLQVFEEGGVVVGGAYGVPVLVLPRFPIAYPYVFHQAFGSCAEVGLVYWHGQAKYSVWGINGAAVADCLLVEVLVLLYNYRFARTELGEP